MVHESRKLDIASSRFQEWPYTSVYSTLYRSLKRASLRDMVLLIVLSSETEELGTKKRKESRILAVEWQKLGTSWKFFQIFLFDFDFLPLCFPWAFRPLQVVKSTCSAPLWPWSTPSARVPALRKSDYVSLSSTADTVRGAGWEISFRLLFRYFLRAGFS